MRRVIGYTETGQKRWSENEPATPLVHASRGGHLVVGEHADGRLARRIANAEAARRYRERKAEGACDLTGRCRHAPCVSQRVAEVRRLYATTNLTLAQIGMVMGGRDHSTVTYWLHEYQDRVA